MSGVYDAGSWFGIAAALAAGLRLMLHRPAAGARAPTRLARALWFLVALAVCALAGTAWTATLRGLPLAGWALLWHVIIGGALSVLLLPLALRLLFHRLPSHPLARAAWVLTLLAGAASATSMLLATLPHFGTAAQEQLLDLHRWCGLLCVFSLAACGLAPAVNSRTPSA